MKQNKRVPFDSVFKRTPEGGISPLFKIGYKGLVIGPEMKLMLDSNFQGTLVSEIIGHDLEIAEGTITDILRIY